MKIDNATHWRADHIRRIALKVAETELDAGRVRRFTVRVRYGTRTSGVSGHAQYYSASCQVNVSSVNIDPVSLAHTLAHEMAHTRGLRHRQMRGSDRYTYTKGWRDVYAWAAAYPIERVAAPPRVMGTALDLKKLEHARTMQTAKERAAKRAAKLAAKWRSKVHYYERKLERAASRPAPTPAATAVQA